MNTQTSHMAGSSYCYTVTLKSQDQTATTADSFLENLIAVTCKLLDIETTMLYQHDKRARVKYGRWMVWEIMTASRAFTLKDCGRIFGEFDHTTVVYGLDRLPLDIRQNELIAAIYSNVIKTMQVKIEDIELLRSRRAFNKKDRLIRAAKIEI